MLGKNGGGIRRRRTTVEFIILAWTVYQRIQYTEHAQLQAAVYKTDCSCMYIYFIAIITN